MTDSPLGPWSWLKGWLRRRQPVFGAAEPDEDAPGADARTVREALERRRRNEQVRQREFGHLRQLRQRGIGVATETGGSQLSLFDAMLPAHAGAREQTLRKIARAEAQMAHATLRLSAAEERTPGAGCAAPSSPSSDTTMPPPDDAWTASAPKMAPPPAPVAVSAGVPAVDTWPQAEVAPELARAALELARRTTPDRAGPPAGGPALAGALCGDIDALLAPLAAAQDAGAALTVSLVDVTQVDFAAAGCLLDWARAQQGQGRQVQFRDAQPLVAAFLRMVGLTEFAQIGQRGP